MRRVDVVGFVVEKLWSALQGGGARRGATRNEKRAARASYITTLSRMRDRLAFALRMVEETKQRLLKMPLAEMAEHGEELRQRWRDVKQVSQGGVELLEGKKVPPEWERMDGEIRNSLMTLAAGVDVLLSAKSETDADHANRMVTEAGDHFLMAVNRQSRRR
jgi:hypothetical protein